MQSLELLVCSHWHLSQKGKSCSQEALERHQRFFVWDEAGDGGIYTMVEKELALRAHNMGTVQSVL